MNQYRVTVAHRETGAEKTATIEARTEAHARQLVADYEPEYVVGKVVDLGPPPQPTVADLTPRQLRGTIAGGVFVGGFWLALLGAGLVLLVAILTV